MDWRSASPALESAVMITDQDIQDLIRLPKIIVAKRPAMGHREENGQRRCDLDLRVDEPNPAAFKVFIRQNIRFIENFSIGLRYESDDRTLRTITLVRYNGPHGEISRGPDGHYTKPHIHRITAAEIASGITHPQESHREITTRYTTYEQALTVFFDDIQAYNHTAYFPGLGQERLFNGHR